MADDNMTTRHIAGEKANPARGTKLKSALRANLQRRKAKAKALRNDEPVAKDEQKPH